MRIHTDIRLLSKRSCSLQTSIGVRYGIWFLILGTSAFAFAVGQASPAQEVQLAAPTSREERVVHAVRRTLPTVVAIMEAPGGQARDRQRTLGSGVIISADGLILSQYHVSHFLEEGVPPKSRKPGDVVEVIVHDGRRFRAELLGGDLTYDLSLLRMVEPPVPCPFAALDEKVELKLGEGVIKFGHPMGYREGRAPVVRLGTVICSTKHLFLTDCLTIGGDSGGPYFDLDGRLAGITYASAIPEQVNPLASPRVDLLIASTTSALIQTRIASLLSGEISSPDGKQTFDKYKQAVDVLPDDEWSQGSAARKVYHPLVEKAKSSVVVVRNDERAVALATIVEPGLAVTKASLLPGEPRCELSTGQIVTANVLGIEPRFDVALLQFSAHNVMPIQWSKSRVRDAGSFVSVPGLEDLPLVIGVVSVARRDLQGPFPARVEPMPRMRATLPEVIGSAVQGRGYWVEFVDGRAADAGIQPGDVLLTIGGHAVRGHADLARCIEGRWAGESVKVELLRTGRRHEVTMSLRANGEPRYSVRNDRFPTVFEHDAPLHADECGGPVLDLEGNALGITIARAPQGCAAIPGDCIENLLPDLKSGKFADNWTAYRQALRDRDRKAATQMQSRPTKPAGVTLDELKDKLRERNERFKSLLVDYDVVSEPDVDPQLLMAWNVQMVRDFNERHRIGFSGTKRLSEVTSPAVQMWNAPKDRVMPDPLAPASLFQNVERQRRGASTGRQEGKTDHLFRLKPTEEHERYLFDGSRGFQWDSLRQQFTAVPSSRFRLADMYLSGLGLRPMDPEPTAERRAIQMQYSFPTNFELYDQSLVLPDQEFVDAAPCISIKAMRRADKDGKRVEQLIQLWLDPDLDFAPRRWEQRTNGTLTQARTNSDFKEWAPGCWLPLKSAWIFYTPEWVAPDLQGKPAYHFNLRLRMAQVNNVGDEHFRPLPAK
jgi:serine protease Do